MLQINCTRSISTQLFIEYCTSIETAAALPAKSVNRYQRIRENCSVLLDRYCWDNWKRFFQMKWMSMMKDNKENCYRFILLRHYSQSIFTEVNHVQINKCRGERKVSANMLQISFRTFPHWVIKNKLLQINLRRFPHRCSQITAFMSWISCNRMHTIKL